MNDVLNYAIENGILNLEYVQQQVELKRRKTIIADHKFKIWQGTNGFWYTYLPDDTKGRILKKKNSEQEIEDCIIEYYRGHIENSLLEIISVWLDRKLENNEITKQTYDRYKTDTIRFFEDTDIGNTEIDKIKEWQLEDFIKDTIREQQLTNKAYAGMRLILLGTFKYAHKRGMTKISITSFFDDMDISSKMFRKPVKTAEKIGFNDLEVSKIEKWIWEHDKSITNLAILLGFYTGMRVGEICALKHSDIDFEHCLLNVSKTEVKQRNDDGVYVYDVREGAKTDAGNRIVVLNNKAIKILRRIIELNPNGEYLIIGDKGRVKNQNVTHKLYYICERLNIPRRSMHKTRKTYCTKMLNAKVSESFIISQMGHTDISTSKEFYYYDNTTNKKAKRIVNSAITY